MTSITIPSSVTSISRGTFDRCTGLTSITIPEGVTSIGKKAFNGCTGLTTITIPSSVTDLGTYIFDKCSLFGLRCKAQTPPTMQKGTYNDETTFSNSMFYHTVLYIPSGCWKTYAFDDDWYQFINIREESTTTSEVKSDVAYTLMNTQTYGYLIYDEVNNRVKNVASVANVDESNPDHCWMSYTVGGETYVYNLGAQAYLCHTASGYSLSKVPAAIKMTDTEDGVTLGTTEQWSFVKNDKMQSFEDLTPVQGIQASATQPRDGKYLHQGRLVIRRDGREYNASGVRIK